MKENALLKNISRYITLTEEEVEIFKSFWTEKHWRKENTF